jgi:zinc/manganese transport system ATP-binding protein
MSTREAAIAIENLTLGYRRHPAVHHLSGRFAPGTLTAVVGPNGAGKSTLLKGIMGHLSPFSGRIRLEGARRREIAYLPQMSEIDRTFPISVFDLVSLGTWSLSGLFGGIGASLKRRTAEALSAVGLEGFENRPIGTLSGGQMQRALFARMLIQDAPLILLDEPFAAIDARTQGDLLALIKRWHGERRTIIAVLHDLDLVRAHFPDALLLAREPVAWGKTDEMLTAQNLLKARAMCEAFHDDAHVCTRTEAA